MKARRFLLLGLCAPVFFHAVQAVANPVGGTVAAGSATFSRPNPGVLNINQTSDRAIINWKGFSIGAGEATRFNQPGANSAVLNRVLSGNPSEIYGTLQANGHVYLINPSGILVGPGGQINTRSFMGSTLDLPDSSFLAGVGMHLSGSSTASVRNQGSIQALGGDVFLFAHTVENSGTIQAPNGTVGLAAGSEVVLQQAGGNERVAVIAGNTSAPQAATGVNNVGAIQAAAAELKAAGGNIYALAINNGGTVRANSLVQENGRIVLRASGGNIRNSGTLSAGNADGSGGSITLDGGRGGASPSTVVSSGVIEARGDRPGTAGGEVKVLGDRVGLTDHALVDVSGQAGGGTALIGGDLHGANPSVQNAQRTLVGADATIRADALGGGNGGKVVVWSDAWTRFFGTISGTGGRLGGNGGFAEVSSKGYLEFLGGVNVSGTRGGQNGIVLLDPATITVQAGSPDLNGDGTPGDDIAALTDLSSSGNFAGLNSVITATAVGGLLTGSKTLILAATVSETVNAPITGTGNASLTLDAPTVTLNSAVTLTGSGTLSGSASGTFNLNAPVTAGSVSLNNVNFGVSGTTLSPSVRTSGAQSYGGAVTLSQDTVLESTASGNVTFSSTIDGAKSLAVNTAGATRFNGVVGGSTALASLTTDESAAAAGSKGGTVSFGFVAPGAGTAAGVNVDTLSLNDSATLNISGSTTANPSVRTGPGGQAYNAALTLSQNTVLESSAAGNVSFASTVDGGKTLAINTAGATTFGDLVGSGTALTSLTTDQAAAPAGSKGGTVAFSFAGPGSGSDAGVNAGAVTFNDAVTLNVSGSTTARPSVRTGAGGQTYNGAVTLGGDTILESTAGGAVAFGSTLDGAAALAVNTAGATTFGGVVGGGTALNSLLTDQSAAASGSKGGTVAFNLTAPGSGSAAGVNAGTVTLNEPTTLNIAGSTTVNPSIRTSGAQNYNDTVTLSQNTVLESTANGAITFAATVDGTSALAINTAGTTTFNDLVGATTVLGDLTTDQAAAAAGSKGGTVSFSFSAPGSGTAAGINAATLTLNDAATLNIGSSTTAHPTARTSGAQTFGAAVTLNQNTVLESTAGGVVNFGSTVDGTKALAVNTAGATKFNGVVGGLNALNSLTTDQSAAAAGSKGGSVSFTFAAPSVGTAAGVNAGTVAFNDSATIGISGSTTAHPSIRTTSGGQTFNSGVTLSQDTVLESTGGDDIAFVSTLDGPGALAVNTSGATSFGGVVGAGGALASLTTDQSAAAAGSKGGTVAFNLSAPGSGSAAGVNAGSLTLNDGTTLNIAAGTTANPSIRTSGDQAYNAAVTLSQDTFLESSAAGNVAFASTINSKTAGSERSLQINTTGNESFGARVGGSVALSGLSTDTDPLNRGGQTIFNVSGSATATPTVKTTTGNQTYNDAAQLSQDTVLTASGGSGTRNIVFNSTVTGAQKLEVNTPGVTHFGGQVGTPVTQLTSLLTDLPGTSELCAGAYALTLTLPDLASIGGLVNSVSPLTYANAVTVCGDVTITAPSVSFSSTVNGTGDGAQSLGIVGSATFSAGVGLTIALKSVNVSGNTAINGGGVKTSVAGGGSGDQTYTGPMTLGKDTVLTGGTTTFGSTVTGNGHDLTLNFSGPTLIDGANFSGINNLATGNGGLTQLKNTITTSGSQTYGDDVQLLANTALDTTGGGAGAAISFNGLLNGTTSGTETLGLKAGNGAISFGATGGSVPLGAVTISSASGVTVNNFSAVSLQQLAGSGATTLNGAVNTTAAAGVDLTAAAIGVNGAINTLGGSVRLAADTAVNSSPGGTITTTGGGGSGTVDINVTGNGNVNLQGAISTLGLNGTIVLPAFSGAAVTIGTANGSLAVGDINTSGGAAAFLGAGGAAAPITLNAGGANGISLHGNLAGLGGSGLFFGPGAIISLHAGNGVDGANGAVAGAALALDGSGNFALANPANHVDVIAANVSGPISYTDAGSVQVGTVGLLSGLTAGNNPITLTMDQLDIAQAINSGTARTLLQPLTVGRDVELGGGALGSRLNLSQAELDLISAGVLEIGQAGNIDVSGAISLNPARVTTLSLVNNGSVGGAGSLAVQNLSLNSAGPVNLPGPNSVATLAASLSGSGQSFYFNNLGDLAVVTVDGVSGITTKDGDATLVTGAKLSLANDVNIGAGVATLNHVDALSGAGKVTASRLNLQGAGNVGAPGLANNLNISVGAIGLAKSGGNSFVSQDPTKGVYVGGATGGGDFTLSAGPTTIGTTALDGGIGNLVLNTTTLALGQDVRGGAVTLNNSAALTRTAGAVSGSTLTLQGGGDVGAAGAANNLNTSVNAISLAKAGGNTFLNQDPAKTVDIGGLTGNGSVTLDAAAATVNTAALNAGAGSVTLNTTTLDLAQDVQGAAVTFNNSAALSRTAGTVSGSTLTLQGGGDVGAPGAANSLNTSVDAISLAKSGGNAFLNQDAARTVDLGGATGGGNVTLTAGPTTVNTVALDAGGGNVSLNTTTLALGQDVSGASVTINNNAALTRSAGTVSGAALALQGAGDVGANGAAGSLNTSVDAISLAKSGGNTFLNQDPARLVDISGTTGNGNVTLNGGPTTVNTAPLDAGAGNIVLNTTTLALGQDVRGASVTINNNAALTRTAGVVGGTTLTLQGSGDVGAPGAPGSLNTSVNVVVLARSGGNVFINQDSAKSVDIGGTTGGGDLTLSAGNITQDIANPARRLTVAGNSTFTAIGGSSIKLGNDGNNFGGPVTIASSDAAKLKDVTIHDTSDFDIRPLAISGTLDVKSVNGNITQSGVVEADTLAAAAPSLGKSITLGVPDVPGATKPQAFDNQINNLGPVTAGGDFYLFDSAGGLNVLGPVHAGSAIVRTFGNLTLGQFDSTPGPHPPHPNPLIEGTGLGVYLSQNPAPLAPRFNVILSAETADATISKPAILNYYGANAIQADGAAGYVLFSFDPALNNLNGLTAKFQNNGTYAAPGSPTDPTAFLFATSAKIISQAAGEAAKVFVDVVKIKPYSGAGSSEADTPLPPIFPTIWTSSYEVYRLEKAEAGKHLKKQVSLLQEDFHLSLALD